MTVQVPELVVIDGKLFRIEDDTEPLESYFFATRSKPDIGPQSTACWRGYVAIWSIEASADGRGRGLHLLEIDQPTSVGTMSENWPLERDWPLAIEKVFPGDTPPILARWFSGPLTLASHERRDPHYLQADEDFTRDHLIFELREGMVVDERPESWADRIKARSERG